MNILLNSTMPKNLPATKRLFHRRDIQTWTCRHTFLLTSLNKSFLYCMPKSVAYCTSSNDSRSKLPPSIDFNALSERRLIAPLRSSRDAIRDKFSSMYKSYEDYSLTNEVREAHGHVERVQEELKLAQQRRTAVSRELSEIQHNLHLIHGDLVTCKREEPRYLELIRREFELNHLEKQKLKEFEIQDTTEREIFMHLQAAVKTSHEKEKIHTNSAKYWSIVGSLLGALLGICGTAFSFYNRNNTITTMLDQVNSDFILLRNDTTSIKNEMTKIHKLNKAMYELQMNQAKQAQAASNESWSSWSWSWTKWAGNKMGIVTVYRYIAPNTER